MFTLERNFINSFVGEKNKNLKKKKVLKDHFKFLVSGGRERLTMFVVFLFLNLLILKRNFFFLKETQKQKLILIIN